MRDTRAELVSELSKDANNTPEKMADAILAAFEVTPTPVIEAAVMGELVRAALVNAGGDAKELEYWFIPSAVGEKMCEAIESAGLRLVRDE